MTLDGKNQRGLTMAITLDRQGARVVTVEDRLGNKFRVAVLSNGQAICEPEYARVYTGDFGESPVYGSKCWHAAVGTLRNGLFEFTQNRG